MRRWASSSGAPTSQQARPNDLHPVAPEVVFTVRMHGTRPLYGPA